MLKLPDNDEIKRYLVEAGLGAIGEEIHVRSFAPNCNGCVEKEGLRSATKDEAVSLLGQVKSHLDSYLGADPSLAKPEILEPDIQNYALIHPEIADLFSYAAAHQGALGRLTQQAIELSALGVATGNPMALTAGFIMTFPMVRERLNVIEARKGVRAMLSSYAANDRGQIWLGETGPEVVGFDLALSYADLLLLAEGFDTAATYAAPGLAERLAGVGARGIKRVNMLVGATCMQAKDEVRCLAEAERFIRTYRSVGSPDISTVASLKPGELGAAYFMLKEREALGNRTWNPGDLRDFYKGYLGGPDSPQKQ